jgi:hypothetical protein
MLVALADNLTMSEGGNKSILAAPNNNLDPASIYAISFSNQSYGPQGHSTTCNNYSHMMDSEYGVNDYHIQECLAIKAEEHCQLLYSPPICIVIALTASAKVMAMFLAARIGRSRPAPLLTVGDAVASFMAKPDPTTEGMCWVSSVDIRRGHWKPPCRT